MNLEPLKSLSSHTEILKSSLQTDVLWASAVPEDSLQMCHNSFLFNPECDRSNVPSHP